MQTISKSKKIILLILDGWGHSNLYHGNAIKQSHTPNLDFLWHSYPSTLLQASGKYVGLPENQMGNSEVGHTAIGSGRVINQELVKIDESIQLGKFFQNNCIHNIYQSLKEKDNKIHIIGICSDGGVHGHINHLIALLKISKIYKNRLTCLHLITDGRDTEPQKAHIFIDLVEKQIKNFKHIHICTLTGRYYAMDRDSRWLRTEKMYRCLTSNTIIKEYNSNSQKVIFDFYRNKIYDEFIEPTRVQKGAISEGDGLIFFNFRPDRMRQLVQSFSSKTFQSFARKKFNHLQIITFTEYDSKFKVPVVFPKTHQKNFLGEIISNNNLKQLRLAETEKYAHVTYFFNGGQEEPFAGEDRQMIPSPKVNKYDSKPEMSIKKVMNELIKAIQKDLYDLIVVNFANPDMIGHTGHFNATKTAVEIVDMCIGDLMKHINKENLTTLITADHGNAEKMFNDKNIPCKTHTTNPVPFIMINKEYLYQQKDLLISNGSLANIAPTILELLSIKSPNDMSHTSLISQHDLYTTIAKNQ